MHTFFHGWRRKTGVVTMMMALPLMSLWIRSYTVFDQVAVAGNLIISNSGCLVWNWLGWGTPDAQITDWYSSQAMPFDEDWYFGRDGVRLPYWSMVVPLTLLSASLLLVPTRKRATATIQGLASDRHSRAGGNPGIENDTGFPPARE